MEYMNEISFGTAPGRLPIECLEYEVQSASKESIQIRQEAEKHTVINRFFIATAQHNVISHSCADRILFAFQN